MVDLAGLDNAVFARLASEAAGSAVRALLGAGAASVIAAEDLHRYEGQKLVAPMQLPAVPLIALRRGPSPIADRIAWLPSYTWYCYGSLAAGVGALRPLAMLVAEAYEGFDPPGLGVGSIEVSIEVPSVDRVLGLWVMPATLDLSSI